MRPHFHDRLRRLLVRHRAGKILRRPRGGTGSRAHPVRCPESGKWFGGFSRSYARSRPASAERKFRVASDIVFFIIIVGCEDQAHAAGRKIGQLPPDHDRQIETAIRPVKLKPTLDESIVTNHVEASHHRDQDLLKPAVSMSSPRGTPRNIVQIVHAPDRKRNRPLGFQSGQASASVAPFGKFNDVSARRLRHLQGLALDGTTFMLGRNPTTVNYGSVRHLI